MTYSYCAFMTQYFYCVAIYDLSKANCAIHSYADDSSLHYSSFSINDSQQELHNYRIEATGHLNSDLTTISE